MADASLDVTPADRPRLIYPFEGPPAPGTPLEVAPGVHWLRMPLPYALNHINLWTIADGEGGIAIVDTGTRTEDVAATWHTLFAGPLAARAPTRVFVTHMHPDHVGMAGWITRKFNVRLWMSRLEYLSVRVMAADTGREAPPDAIAHYRRAGWGEAAIESYRVRFGNFGKHIHALPESYQRLSDGDTLRIGNHSWRVIIGSGHSPEHACLYCPELKLLVSGDQVLPRISSNVSVNPMEPEADPLGDWMASLEKLKRLVDDDVLVLPAHNEPFRGLHARLDALHGGQLRALDRLLRRLAEPRRAIDVFGALFARQIAETDVGLLGMATGESIACLNYLLRRGKISARTDEAGVRWYQAIEATGASSVDAA